MKHSPFWTDAKRRIWNLANLPALVATIVVLIALLADEQINRDIYVKDMRAEVHDEAVLMASKLQGLITTNVESVRGLASTIATEPNFDQARFAKLAENLLHNKTQIQNIAGAPDLVISLMYPVKGNEAAIGLDYRKNEAQKKIALHVRDTGKVQLAGPVDLVQGGQGLIARFPIFYDNDRNELQFWGILSAVIRMDAVEAVSGLATNPNIEFSLIGKDGTGAEGEHFYGPVFDETDDPVFANIDFLVGSWQLQAVPRGGWNVTPPNVWAIRSLALIAYILIVVPFAIVGWLYRDRYSVLKANVKNQQEIAKMSKRLELALTTSQIGVWEFDPKARKSIWDDRMKELYGFESSEVISDKVWQARLHPDDRARVISEVHRAIDVAGMYKSQFRVVLPDGREKTIRAAGSIMEDDNGGRRLFGVNWDISEDVARENELKDARAEIERRCEELEVAKARNEANSLHDFLTGLPNRRYLDEQLNFGESDNASFSPDISLLKIDLDGFKEVNDSFGHAAGDAMLVAVGNALRNIVNQDEFTARVGGDEFVVLCSRETNPERPVEIARQITETIQKPIEFKGFQCKLGASVGISHGSDAKGDPDKLLSNADLALYQSKQKGKGRYSFFSLPLFEQERDRRKKVDDLLRGIENREFVAYYQGQYCAKTHALHGAEALVRWDHPTRGILSPFEFLDLAEELGVVAELDAMVFDHALSARRKWIDKGLILPRMSVNVSAKRLGEKDLIPRLKELEMDPGTVTFELVESTFLDRSEKQVAANIRQIKDMGIDIEIDDFGTAYASIVSLMHLLPNRLKIDRQLVQPIIESADQRELVHSIIHIGRTLGIGTIAEGVETMEHAEILKVMGADILQGFAFSRPCSSEEFLRTHLQRCASQSAS